MTSDSHYPQPNTFAAYLLLTATWFVALVVVAFPMLGRVLSASLRANAKWWERADAIAILICLLLQSGFGAFFLWRSGRSKVFGWQVFRGIAYGILSFLVTIPLAFLIMKGLYKPAITIPPAFFFALIFYLGHRVPLLGLLLGGFLVASTHWELTKTRTQP